MTCPSENALLHFTSAKNAALILRSLTLNFGGLGNSNDLSENPRLLDLVPFTGNVKPREEFLQDSLFHRQYVRQIQNMGFICLSKFTVHPYDESLLLQDPDRFELMMGHYASQGQGICLIFDKSKFIEELKYRGNDANYHTVHHGEVSYANSGGVWDLSKLSDYRDLASGENLSRLFIKRKVWEPENEYRVVQIPNAGKPQNEIPKGVNFDREALIGFVHCTLANFTYPWSAEAKMYIDTCRHSPYKPAEYEFIPYGRGGKGGSYISLNKQQ